MATAAASERTRSASNFCAEAMMMLMTNQNQQPHETPETASRDGAAGKETKEMAMQKDGKDEEDDVVGGKEEEGAADDDVSQMQELDSGNDGEEQDIAFQNEDEEEEDISMSDEEEEEEEGSDEPVQTVAATVASLHHKMNQPSHQLPPPPVNNTLPLDNTKPRRPKRKKLLKKAPNAPKRFTSAFIHFSVNMHRQIRAEMGNKSTNERVRLFYESTKVKLFFQKAPCVYAYIPCYYHMLLLL